MTSFWLLVSVAIVVIYLFNGGLTYINCKSAVKGYLEIFKNESGRPSLKELLFFILLPLTLAAASQSGRAIEADVTDVICVVISILTAMIYSFMAIISSKYENVIQKNDSTNKIDYFTADKIQKIYNETISIITCEILVSVLLLVLCFVQPVVFPKGIQISAQASVEEICWLFIFNAIGYIIYSCFYFFVLNILVVTKRFYYITSNLK